MPLAVGSNIHFSPVDNKPLCSYSNKLCRQRRLNGYGFCIRHILEDKSAPFKQCEFVTRNNSQKCLNAIPTNQERGYCHSGSVTDLCKSHMQVAGIIPKTVKKVKPPASTTLCSKPSTGDKSTAGVGLQLSSNGLKTPNYALNGIKPPPSKSTPKPKAEKGKTNASTNSSSTSSTATNAATSINNNNSSDPSNHLGSNGFLPPPPPPDLIPKKKGKKGNGGEGQVPKPPPKSKKKKVTQQSPSQSLCPPKWNSATTDTSSATAFEQLKTLKILEKLTLRTGGETKGFVSSDEQPPEISFVPPFLKSSNGLNPSLSTLDENENNSNNSNSSESRSEFLKRVRSSFQSQFKLLRNVVKGNEKSEVRVNEALRESLLSCVLIDPSRCAHILVNGEDEVEMDSRGKKMGSLPVVKPPNGVLNGKRKDKGSSLQGSQSNPNLQRPENGTTKPKKGKGKKMKKEEVACGDDVLDLMNPVQVKIENGQVVNQFLDPWINGNFKILETLKPGGKKTKSKAKAIVKIESDCRIIEDKKVPVQRKQQRNGSWKQETGNNGHVNLPPPIKNLSRKEVVQGRTVRHGMVMENGREDHFNNNHSTGHLEEMPLLDSIYSDHSFAAKKRRIELSESASTIMSNGIHHHHHHHLHHHHPHQVLDPNITLNATAAFHTAYSPSDLSAVAQLENVLNSVSSSETATTPDGVITDASFDSPFDHSTSSHPDCDFPDDVDDLEKSFELHIDPEIAHQASRLIEENGFTEDDFSELFPDNRLSDGKLGSELGLDFSSSNFEPTDIDYAIFSNIFPSTTSNYHRSSGGSNESAISITHNF